MNTAFRWVLIVVGLYLVVKGSVFAVCAVLALFFDTLSMAGVLGVFGAGFILLGLRLRQLGRCGPSNVSA